VGVDARLAGGAGARLQALPNEREHGALALGRKVEPRQRAGHDFRRGGLEVEEKAERVRQIEVGEVLQDLAFYPITPCRLADTRGAAGTFGAPSLAGSAPRTFPVSGNCGIPATAQAYAFNMTVVPSGPLGFLSAWPAGNPQPGSSTLNAPTGVVTSNMAVVPAGTGGAITVVVTNPTDLIIDINGYFAPPGAGSLDFYTATPCRILDTRDPAGPFGGPALVGGQARAFPVPSSSCNIPATAKAYSLNATIVPPAPLGFLSMWGSGPQPAVSTLNSPDGAALANAALLPAGASGEVTAITTHATHLILDINGYFQ